MESDNELSHEQLEALRVQLTELNNRGRWYSSQLWQVPFAYLGVTGLLLSQIKLAETQAFILIVVSVAFFGAFVIAHMNGIAKGEKRAVKDLQNTETSLGIPQTALYRPNYARPLYILVLLVVCAATLTAIFIVLFNT